MLLQKFLLPFPAIFNFGEAISGAAQGNLSTDPSQYSAPMNINADIASTPANSQHKMTAALPTLPSSQNLHRFLFDEVIGDTAVGIIQSPNTHKKTIPPMSYRLPASTTSPSAILNFGEAVSGEAQGNGESGLASVYAIREPSKRVSRLQKMLSKCFLQQQDIHRNAAIHA